MLLRRAVVGLTVGRAESFGGPCKAIVSLQDAYDKAGGSSFSQIYLSWQQQQTRGEKAIPRQAHELPLETGRARLVVLGTGWAAARLIRDINPKLFDFTVGARLLRGNFLTLPKFFLDSMNTFRWQTLIHKNSEIFS